MTLLVKLNFVLHFKKHLIPKQQYNQPILRELNSNNHENKYM